MSSMDHHTVTHLATGKKYQRPWIHYNKQKPNLDDKIQSPTRQQTNSETTQNPTPKPLTPIEKFHHTLPNFTSTPLTPLPSLANKLSLSALYLKPETSRLGLPSFKILGASWAVHRVVCAALSLDPYVTSLRELCDAVRSHRETQGHREGKEVRIVACTEGNWGRAVARVGKWIGVPVKIYVPAAMGMETRDLIAGEGAEVTGMDEEAEGEGEGKGTYDDALEAIRRDARETGALVVMDTSWEGYEEVPGWVTEGYSTLLQETDRQIASLGPTNQPANLAIVGVGVGSWAHATVAHYTSPSSPPSTQQSTQILTVEPASAPSLSESLHNNIITPIETQPTIMAGLNCGTTSKIAWPVLRDGVGAAVVITDREAHEAVEELKREAGVAVGPCGGATLAALRKVLVDLERGGRGNETRGWRVVLFATEGGREYQVPM